MGESVAQGWTRHIGGWSEPARVGTINRWDIGQADRKSHTAKCGEAL